MDISQIFTLSIVQGITEFLPISSSAHLILVPALTTWEDQGLLFDIALHVGTLLAVMIYFYKDVGQLVNGGVNVLCGRFKTQQAGLFLMLVLSTLPLVVVAPFIKDYVEIYARHIYVIAATSIVYGLLLWWVDRLQESKLSVNEITPKNALVWGTFQVLALVPGTSRSGICMTAGRMMGFDRVTSSRYAMLMAIPVILMIGGYSLLSDFDHGVNIHDDLPAIALGVGLSFVSALAAIHILMKLVTKFGFLPFVIYRVLLGIFLIIWAQGVL